MVPGTPTASSIRPAVVLILEQNGSTKGIKEWDGLGRASCSCSFVEAVLVLSMASELRVWRRLWLRKAGGKEIEK
jgi:hypothetical protein